MSAFDVFAFSGSAFAVSIPVIASTGAGAFSQETFNSLVFFVAAPSAGPVYQDLSPMRRPFYAGAMGRQWNFIECTTWPAKYPSERITVEFDFGRDLPPGDKVTAVAMFFTTVKGSDAAPAALLYGTVQIKGARAFMKLQGGLAGCAYRVVCQATTQNDNLLVLTRVLPVVPL